MAATETQPSHDDWDKVVMNITTEDKSMNDNDQYESLRGLSLRQLREAKQVRAVHRSMAYRPTNAVSKSIECRSKLEVFQQNSLLQ